MADLFPPLFGEDHQDQDADAAKYEDAPSFFVGNQPGEQNVNDKGDTQENAAGFKQNNDGVNQNFYQNNDLGENNGGVGDCVHPIEQGEGIQSTVPIEENGGGIGQKSQSGDDGTRDKINNEGARENKDGVGENADKDGDLLPVEPGESGEGLPYAPADWPNPGDIWGWKVGKRYANNGFFNDRFITPPKRLQSITKGYKTFQSKAAVSTYLRSNFPDADVDAFFASFSWRARAKVPSSSKAAAPSEDPQDAVQRVLEELREEIPHTATGRPKRQSQRASAVKEPEPKAEEKPAPRTSGRKRKQQAVDVEEPEPEPEPESVEEEPPQKTPRSSGRSRNKKEPVSSPPAEKKSTRKGALSASKSPQNARQSGRRQSKADAEVPPPVPNIPEDFDNYLNSLEDIITQPPVQSTQISDLGDFAMDDMAEARSKLSTLLEMDFPSLIEPKTLNELTSLASKLRNDPFLNAEQLVMLKLIEEIPLYSEVYTESRDIIEKIDNQFSIHEGNKVRVNSLKEEYNELKDKADQLQSQMDSSAMMVQEIDNEIARLQFQRSELLSMIASNKASKEDLNNNQKVVASTIPGIVKEIQVANSKVPEWVVRKTNAANREAQVLAKFAPLKGFSL